MNDEENIKNKKMRYSILDSSLMFTTKSELYNIRLVNCGEYIQVYSMKERKIKVKKEEKEINIKNFDTDNLRQVSSNNIELKNITRSKLECQRLVKANSKDWKTFITLTFEENIIDIKQANKKFRNFIDSVKRIYSSFKYIAIPEFQKRGAVHYHLLTNISIDNYDLIYEQENNKKFKHIKYWNEGFTKVDIIENDIKKIVGYISKYMTKKIDKRMFNKKRYYYSRNLMKPTISYLDLENFKHLEFYNKLLNDRELIYENTYYNTYSDEMIEFKEFLK